MGKFELFRDVSGQFRFRLKAENQKIILQSEAYITKQSCENGIESVKNHAADDSNYVRSIAKNGEYYFNLRAKNFEIIGTSEMYKSVQGRENGILSVKHNAPIASIHDLTT